MPSGDMQSDEMYMEEEAEAEEEVFDLENCKSTSTVGCALTVSGSAKGEMIDCVVRECGKCLVYVCDVFDVLFIYTYTYIHTCI